MSTVRDLFQRRRVSGLVACKGRSILVAANLFLSFSLALWGQTPPSAPSDVDQSWTITRDSHIENALPTRTIETHVRDGDRVIDKQSVQRSDSEGHFEGYQDIEKETVQVNSTTLKTITRIFGRDGGGNKALVEITEEQTQLLPDGARTVRVVSTPDADGRPQPSRREVAETKKISQDVEETKTMVMLPDGSGGLAPGMRIEERRQQSAGNTTYKRAIELPDGGREWQVNEVRQGTIKQKGNSRTTEENVSRLDYEGKLSDFSRTVSTESESPSGEKHSTVENYSVDMPGASRDGTLHLIQRVRSTETTDSTGQPIVVQQLEEPNPGDREAGLRMTSFSTETVRSSPTNAEATRTVRVRNGSGEFEVFAVDNTKADNIHAIHVQMTPPGKP